MLVHQRDSLSLDTSPGDLLEVEPLSTLAGGQTYWILVLEERSDDVICWYFKEERKIRFDRFYFPVVRNLQRAR